MVRGTVLAAPLAAPPTELPTPPTVPRFPAAPAPAAPPATTLAMAFHDRLSGLPGQIARPRPNPRLPWLARLLASHGPRVSCCSESQFFRRLLLLRLSAQTPRHPAWLFGNPTSGSIAHLA